MAQGAGSFAPQDRKVIAFFQFETVLARKRDGIMSQLERERKVRTPNGSTGVNDPPPQGEEQWNRENVQSFDLLAGNGRP